MNQLDFVRRRRILPHLVLGLALSMADSAAAAGSEGGLSSRVREVLGGGTAATTEASDGTAIIVETNRPRRYLVGPLDVLAVTVFTQDEAQLKQENSSIAAPVSETGDILLPLIGQVRAAGKTTPDLALEIRARYQHFLKAPQVNVTVLEHRSKVVWVAGQVVRNGPIYLQDEETSLFEVISRAEGLVRGTMDDLGGADEQNIVVIRGPKKFVVDFAGQALEKATAREFLMQPGDRVYVPRPQNRVQILGGVRDAREIRLYPGMTMLEAIAKAGSFTKGSRRHLVKILRESGETIPVDATQVFKGRAPDVPLEPGDIIYVTEW